MPQKAKKVARQDMLNLVREIAFELVSSDFEGRPFWHCDLLVVLKHDWPACPVKVVELAGFLPEHKDVRPRHSDRTFSPLSPRNEKMV